MQITVNKKKYKISATLFLLSIFLQIHVIIAQELNVTATVPITGEERFSVCGGERFITLRVENTTGAGGNTATTLSNIVATLNLSSAVGLKFTGNVQTIDKSLGLADVSISNAATPSFALTTLGYTQFVEL